MRANEWLWCYIVAYVCVCVSVCASSTASTRCGCRFANSFTTQSLLSSPSSQDEFLRCVMEWEAHFGAIAYNAVTGLTYDGHGIDYETGRLAPPLHYWSAPSKESLHLMMIARALAGDEYASIFLSPQDPSLAPILSLSLLERKLSAIEKWNRELPGFGGFLPWFFNYDTGIVPADGWANSVPALDNGEMIWGWYAVEVALWQLEMAKSTAASFTLNSALVKQTRERINRYLDLLKATALPIFYDSDGYIRAVATIANTSQSPFDSPSTNYNMDCDPTQPGTVCYLDDPYEGEMFVVFVYLYSEWPAGADRDLLWVNKRPKLQRVDFASPQGPITVQRGWWFSSHEQWKYLALPYLDASPINARVFHNGERARLWNSAALGLPGIHASVSDVAAPGQPIPDYLGNTGIPSISFQPDQVNDVVTPYGSFPALLSNFTVGLCWYLQMIQGPSMQGPFGSTESINISATAISPVLTWDSKITSVVAMVGGVSSLSHAGLERDGLYDQFGSVINREWGRVFTRMHGEDLDLPVPAIAFPPSSLGDFTDCVAE